MAKKITCAEKALRLISRKMLSSSQLSQKLFASGYDEDEIAITIENCKKNIPDVKRRFEIKKSDKLIIINDSYNSNFAGFKECLKYMSKYEYKKIGAIVSWGLKTKAAAEAFL